MRKKYVLLGILVILSAFIACIQLKLKSNVKRFFSNDSYWNTPINDNPVIHPKSDYWIGLLKQDFYKENFGINLDEYTIPVYQVDENTPAQVIQCREFSHALDKDGRRVYKCGQHPNFQGTQIPLPREVIASPGTDAHLALVDWERNIVWDMWYLYKDDDGEWRSNTGMVYAADGSGVFDTTDIRPNMNESVHGYGPGRAAGVPIVGGLVMYDEVLAGEVNHKIACAVRFVAFQEFIFPPATWTDGAFDGGIPEGSIIQLDPDLDLSQFNLWPGEIAIAKALQKYGMVVVDFAAGNAMYGEGIWYDENKTWKDKVRTWGDEGGLRTIPLDHYRVLQSETVVKKGDRKREWHLNLLKGNTP